MGVGGKAPTKAADDPGKQGLAHEAALAADDAAAHARLAGKADEALDLAHRIAAATMRAGHAGKLHIDLHPAEIAARCAIDEEAGETGRQHFAAPHERTRRPGYTEDWKHDVWGRSVSVRGGNDVRGDD